MKIAIVSPRFINEDMRGNEEVIRTLFQNITSDSIVKVLASDAIYINPLNSILNKLLGQSSNSQSDKNSFIYDERVTYLKSNYLVSGLMSISSHVLNRLLKLFSVSPYSSYLPDIIRVYGWGPYIGGLRRELLKEKFDVLHTSTFPTTSAFLSYKYSKKYNIPFVFTPYYHYKIHDFNGSKVLSSMIKGSQGVVACTELERNELLKLGAEPNQVHVIPLSFDSSLPLKYNLSKTKARETLGIPTNSFTVLIQPWSSKGGVTLLKAVSLLSRDFPHITLITIGNMDSSYRRAKTSLNSDKFRQIDLGWVSGKNKWEAFYASDVFGMLSENDAFGLSYLNSWAVGIPIVAAKYTSASEIIDDKSNGFLVDMEDPKIIADTLIKLAVDIEMRESLGKRGLEKLRIKYSPKVMTDRYMRVFKAVI
ncbi:glycosyltransferase family 4 protein [Ferroplasma sp.]|uniref:glycosyltransferase family 4 protein n=1 Tax=Ferroplasma sp. TaxID=2591003 RepID=UPI00263767DB|nr:glycosyltransferase family 4 protein [Ferroplasma sp.]